MNAENVVDLLKWTFVTIVMPIIMWLYNKKSKKRINIEETLNQILNEIKVNGGAITLRDKVLHILDEVETLKKYREADFYMDPRPRYINDENGSCIAANPAFCSLFGSLDENGVLGDGWFSFIDEDYQETAYENWTRQINNTKQRMISDTYILKNGKRCSYTNVIYRNKEGKIILSQGFVKEVF